MKTELQYLKKNIIIALFWNIPLISLIAVPMSYINMPNYYVWLSTTFIYICYSFYTVKGWYNDERFKYLEEELTKVKEQLK